MVLIGSVHFRVPYGIQWHSIWKIGAGILCGWCQSGGPTLGSCIHPMFSIYMYIIHYACFFSTGLWESLVPYHAKVDHHVNPASVIIRLDTVVLRTSRNTGQFQPIGFITLTNSTTLQPGGENILKSHSKTAIFHVAWYSLNTWGGSWNGGTPKSSF